MSPPITILTSDLGFNYYNLALFSTSEANQRTETLQAISFAFKQKKITTEKDNNIHELWS